ncbi:ABC transporter permease [Candidatus Sumerlaeota bacterium]|nr:ABC transporter permease [Candidatus Sumerlaeota bacterium]
MKRSDGLRVAAASLIENPLRTFLTLLGIAMGVTAVIFVVSMIEGLNRYMGEKVAKVGSSSFTVQKYGILTSHTEYAEARRRNRGIRHEDAEAIRRFASDVERVGIQRGWGVSPKYGSRSVSDVQMLAQDYDAYLIESPDIAQGRGFSQGEVQRGALVCYLGWEVADKLFENRDPVGRKVRLWGRGFVVNGVAKKQGSILGHSQDNFVSIPLGAFEKIFGSRRSINLIVKAKDPLRMEEAVDEVRMVLRARRHLRWDEEDNFGVITPDSLMSFWRKLTQMIFSVALFVVGISLVVGGIVIMNIMLLTVVERTREIGVRKAIGARQKDIRFQFLAESVMLCAAGGVVGVGLGWLLAYLVRTITPLPAAFPLWAPILAVVVTSAVGIFFGLYPARTAADLNPIEALGREAC